MGIITKTMNELKQLIETGKLKEATRDLRYSRQVGIVLDNGLHADYYPKWHRETGADHLDCMRPSGTHNGRMFLATPDEWRSIGQAAEAELIAILRMRFPHLFVEVPQYLGAGIVADMAAEYQARIGEPMHEVAMLHWVQERGLVRVPVVVYFTEYVEISLNRMKKKRVKKATLYLFPSTAGKLCYSTRVNSRVARGFVFTDEMAAKVEGIQELK